MLNSQRIGNELYQHLGKLFYAVAMVDKNIRPIEVTRLREALRKNWLTVDDVEDEFGTDAAYQIEIVFDWLQEQETTGDDYFKEFSNFYIKHKNKFTPKIKTLVLDTAHAIASSFAGKNKSELILLAKLSMLMKY